MNKVIWVLLLAIVCCIAFSGQAIADTQSDAERDYAMARHHDSNTIFFEWIENGIGGKQFVALKFNAGKLQDETEWAECLITLIYINSEQKRTELKMYRTATDDNSIKNLSVAPMSVSFDMNMGWIENRSIRFVATRKGTSSYYYQANAVGLWKGLIDETKIIKVEWRQIPSITLPFPAITP